MIPRRSLLLGGSATMLLTGPGAINDTSKVLLAGADLGHLFTVGERTYFVVGDNFGIRDEDAVGGVGEVTKIPTQGWGIGEDLFLHYMSVNEWGEPGEWWTNHAGLAHSSDEGRNWEIIEGVQWGAESGFTQLAQHLVEEHGTEYLYLWGIPAGRFGPVRLMRVPNDAEAVRDFSRYEYFAGADDGSPTWSSSESDAQVVLDRPTAELSVLWSEYLERWILTTMVEGGSAAVYEGLSPWGPWSEPHIMLTQEDVPGLYGPYMTPRYVGEGGKRVYFTFSIWGPYQVFWYSMGLVKAEQ